MKEQCLEQGMKLAQHLQTLGTRAYLAKSPDDYAVLGKSSQEALNDLEKITCLAENERKVLVDEIAYLQRGCDKADFLMVGNAGERLLRLLHDPQSYIQVYGR
ncbi:MAG: hypothetical protein WC551_08265 [Patescibacteria group bacterium]